MCANRCLQLVAPKDWEPGRSQVQSWSQGALQLWTSMHLRHLLTSAWPCEFQEDHLTASMQTTEQH